MGTIVERLRKYIEFKGIPVSIAERDIGVSNSSLSKPFKSGTTIKTDTLEKFLSFYRDINPTWLLTGSETMLKNEILENNAVESVDYKELWRNSEYTINLQKEKIAKLEQDIAELKYSQKESFLYKNVAEPTPELIGKKK